MYPVSPDWGLKLWACFSSFIKNKNLQKTLNKSLGIRTDPINNDLSYENGLWTLVHGMYRGSKLNLWKLKVK